MYINNVRYEISKHKNHLSSIMKDNTQFALVTAQKNIYTVDHDEKIENDLPLILLLIMYVDYSYRITRRTKVGKGLWFDYKEDRTKWTPAG